MKLLFFTDTHIRGNTPKNRKDVFVDTLEQKLVEINHIIKNNEIDFVLHGGDLFDRPDVSISVASKFAMILDEIQVPFYLISGNHDIYGHNPDTVNRTMLGLLDALGVINLIKPNEKIFLEKNSIRVQLTGQPYVYDIDALEKRDYYILKDVNDDVNFSIHMVHGLLLDRPFIKGVPYTLIDDIKDTLADITLCGHYHSGFKTSKINDKYFINPGSLVRVTNSLREIERVPKAIIIELERDIKIREVPLQSALPGADVLDRQEIEKNLFKNERITEFKQTIDAALDFEKMDINEVLIEVSTAEDVEEEVKVEALRRIASIQMKGLNGD